ncbi:MAG: M15 family metallopeptidase [Firmicutes bacterium]|nr:M15 family metallopeptidase [Bacillota bacterium]
MTSEKSSKDASGFVNLGEEIPELLLDVRYYTSFNFVSERIDGYEAPIILCTKELCEAMKRVVPIFKEKGYLVKVFDAYRPQRAVDHFVRWSLEEGKEGMKSYFYPDYQKEEIFGEYVIKKSSHSRGSAIDFTLVEMATQLDVDMGGTFDFFGAKSYPFYEHISKEQKENRMYLRKVMLENGFIAFPSEWWHFSLEKEPYPDTYFDFPIRPDIIKK